MPQLSAERADGENLSQIASVRREKGPRATANKVMSRLDWG